MKLHLLYLVLYQFVFYFYTVYFYLCVWLYFTTNKFNDIHSSTLYPRYDVFVVDLLKNENGNNIIVQTPNLTSN